MRTPAQAESLDGVRLRVISESLPAKRFELLRDEFRAGQVGVGETENEKLVWVGDQVVVLVRLALRRDRAPRPSSLAGTRVGSMLLGGLVSTLDDIQEQRFVY